MCERGHGGGGRGGGKRKERRREGVKEKTKEKTEPQPRGEEETMKVNASCYSGVSQIQVMFFLLSLFVGSLSLA